MSWTSFPTVEPQLLTQIGDVLADCSGLEVPEQELSGILSSEEPLLNDVRSWGANDTEVRGRLCDTLARELVGRSWPTFGDGEAVGQQFEADLQAAAAQRGWQAIQR